MTDHIGLDVLAALDEGLLSRRSRHHARNHLAGCPACADRAAAIAEVPDALRRAAASEPPPVPAWVAIRLDAALAAETGSNGALDGTAPGGTAPTHAPDRVAPIADAPSRRHRRGPRVVLRPVAAAAAVCVLGGGAYAVYTATGSSGTGSPAADAHSARAGATAPTRGGPLLEPGRNVSGPRVLRIVRTGTDFQPGQLPAQVESVLREPEDANPAAAGAGQSSTTLSPALEGCLERIAPGEQATLVDEARYRGQPATIFVLPEPKGPGGRVWVTGPACSATRSDVLARASISSIP